MNEKDKYKYKNPFPGPQPYRAADRELFFGRDELAKKLASWVLAYPCITVFGPSGAGKSSLLQAAVIPRLEENNDFRVVRVDGWPPAEPPLPWLARALFTDLDLGPPPGEGSPLEAIDQALRLSEERSERPVLVYLDQLEQLLVPSRDPTDVGALVEGIDRLAQAPIRGLCLVLSLREDYLGRFRDRARGRRELLEHGFRLGPLTVGEMVKAVCRAAARGEPGQQWDEAEIHNLVLEVRTPGESAVGEAEVQAAFGQIVCRALWEERATGEGSASPASGVVQAEAILHRYLEATVEGLGPLKDDARRLLEEHLVDAGGHRTLLTEQEARGALSAEAAAEVLGRLERAAVLHAEEHQGSRYFELGHDWLAKRVFERREARLREEGEQRRLDDERRRQEQAERARDEQRNRAEEAASRFRLVALTVAAMAVMAVLSVAVLWAVGKRTEADRAREAADVARKHAEGAQVTAKREAARAHTLSVMAGARELLARDQAGAAVKLMLEVKDPGATRGWVELAHDLLAAEGQAGAHHLVVLRGSGTFMNAAAWSPDGKRIATAESDGNVQVWSADGAGAPLVFKAHPVEVNFVSWSPDGQRIATASEDATARVWSADGSGAPVVLKGHEADVLSATWSPDGQRIVTASEDKTARVWRADGTGEPVILRGHERTVTFASWSPDGQRIVTASEDRTARVWSADGGAELRIFKDHTAEVFFASWSPDGKRIVTASGDQTARVWNLEGKSERVLKHDAWLRCATWSPDGKRIVTASWDRAARVWGAPFEPIVLKGHEHVVRTASWSPDGQSVLTASMDGTARIWPVAVEAIRKLFAAATTECLSVELRKTHLDESESEARTRHDACERAAGRTPPRR